MAIRLLSAGFWSLFGNLSSKGLLLLSTIIVAHILGKNEYGEYSIIRTTVLMFIAFASLGVGATTTKYIAEHRETNIQKAYNIYIVTSIFSIIFGSLTAIVLIFFANDIATYQLKAPYLANSIKLGALLLFFCTINGAQNGALLGFENFKRSATNSLVSSIVEFCSILLLAYIWGVSGAIIGSSIGYIILTIINNRSIQTNFKDKVTFKISQIKKNEILVITKFGLPSALCNLLVIGVLWYTRTLLVQETDFGQVAVFNASDQIKSFILFIPASLSQIILPVLTNINAKKDQSSYKKILWYNILINVSIASLITLFICIFASQILRLWGTDFNDPITLIYLACSTIFASFATVVGQAIASKGKMWIGFLFNFGWSLLVLILSIHFLDQGMGASGLALAIFISYVFHGIFQYIYLSFAIKQNQ